MLNRRNFIKAASTAAIATSSPDRLWARAVSQAPKAKITKIEVVTWKGPKKTAAWSLRNYGTRSIPLTRSLRTPKATIPSPGKKSGTRRAAKNSGTPKPAC